MFKCSVCGKTIEYTLEQKHRCTECIDNMVRPKAPPSGPKKEFNEILVDSVQEIRELMERFKLDVTVNGKGISKYLEIDVLRKENRIQRELLWIRHGCEVGSLYGDDGEMQCNKCNIDFLRDSVEDIKNKFISNGKKEL